MALRLQTSLRPGMSSVPCLPLSARPRLPVRLVIVRSTARKHLEVQCAKGFGKKKASAKKAVSNKPKQSSQSKQGSTQTKERPAPQSGEEPARRPRQLPVAPNLDNNRIELPISLPSRVPELEILDPIEVDDEDFAARLTALKAEGKLKAKVKATQAVAGSSSLGNVLESEPNIYDNPPPLATTIMKELNPGISDPSLQTQTFGPNQLAVAAGALILVVVLVATSVGGFSNSSRYKGVRPPKPPPSEIQATILANQVESSLEALAANPADEAALEGLGYAYSDLYEFDKASDAFQQLVDLPSRKEDLTTWKLFGESSLLAERPAKAVQGFTKAWELQNNDFNVLTNLTNAYIANGDFQSAVGNLKSVQERLKSSSDTTTAAPVSSSADSSTSSPSRLSQASSASVESAAPAATSAPVAGSVSASAEGSGSNSAVAPTDATAGVSDLQNASEVADAIASTSRDASSSEAGDSSGAGPSSGDAGSILAPATPSSSSESDSSAAEEGQQGPSKLRAMVAKKSKRLDPIGVDLLLGKVYSAWRGHDNDATSAYDALIKQYPEDFRGYLAKGVFLRDRGRGVEAKKMFMQARFYTPAGQQALIDRVSKNDDLQGS